MNLSLSDKLEECSSQFFEQGASEGVREGLRLLEISESQIQSNTEPGDDSATQKKTNSTE